MKPSFAVLAALIAGVFAHHAFTPAFAVDPESSTRGSDPARLTRIRAAKMPPLTKPVLFNAPEADAILSAFEIFPLDNAWNQFVTDWPLHPNSKGIVASVGNTKPLRYNPDMAFVLVPPGQEAHRGEAHRVCGRVGQRAVSGAG